jgi:galacturonosyltransferase
MIVVILSNDHIWTYNLRKEIIQAIIQQGHKVFLIMPYGEKVTELCGMGCNFIDIPFERHGTNVIKEIKILYYYHKYLKKIKPDIVFSYTIKPNIYGGIVCRYLMVPFVPNITGLGTAVENGGIIQKITLLLLYKFALKKAQKVFFQNSENRDFMIKHHIVKDSYALLPGSGVNLNHYQVLDYPPQDVIEFAFISRIMKEKGIEQFLDAAKYIRNKYPNTRFHVCGFCEQEYDQILKDLNDNGTIIYHGMVRDVRTILKNVHCTVHPTYYPEGLSNVLLESCACGRPIITTNRSGCREVIDDGINGFICKQKDSEDLIKQIEKFISLPYEKKKQMGLAGRAKVEKEFYRNIVVQAYLDEIERTLSQNGLQKDNKKQGNKIEDSQNA